MAKTIKDLDLTEEVSEDDLFIVERETGTKAIRVGDFSNAKESLADMVRIYSDISIVADAWAAYAAELDYESEIVEEYPYKADMVLEGITVEHCAHVSFAPDEVKDGVFSPYNNTQDGYIRIYAKSKPINAIMIPTIYAVARGV